ncbi:hypothetical protein PPERSA_02450 [Pseudocohnilembus persalinus]|uniref:Uncharacterized protein n=1 Tax=Pseudocohnilembus persalinus TaxID=266149 RepID=A0A0V0QB08_PSEPJ|nr:hypothetical protein PPERSA_02450 [Pseudocohnilembus persalinus]|eukprot:KRW99338.1 hypothetical protein PPERSA_02450 [Pseudocohnilembus persalinus]
MNNQNIQSYNPLQKSTQYEIEIYQQQLPLSNKQHNSLESLICDKQQKSFNYSQFMKSEASQQFNSTQQNSFQQPKQVQDQKQDINFCEICRTQYKNHQICQCPINQLVGQNCQQESQIQTQTQKDLNPEKQYNHQQIPQLLNLKIIDEDKFQDFDDQNFDIEEGSISQSHKSIVNKKQQYTFQ